MPPRLPTPLNTTYVVPDISNIADTSNYSFAILEPASANDVGYVLPTTANAQERPAPTFVVVPGSAT